MKRGELMQLVERLEEAWQADTGLPVREGALWRALRYVAESGYGVEDIEFRRGGQYSKEGDGVRIYTGKVPNPYGKRSNVVVMVGPRE